MAKVMYDEKVVRIPQPKNYSSVSSNLYIAASKDTVSYKQGKGNSKNQKRRAK